MTSKVKDEIVEAKVDNKLAIQDMYQGVENIGTEEMNQEDVNTPNLKLIQSNTKGIKNKNDGYFFRSDTQEQVEMPTVNLVYVTTKESENYMKTKMETQKIYFGYFAGTKEPFKMFIRGYSMRSHRELQSQLVTIKNRYRVPMFALKVQLRERHWQN